MKTWFEIENAETLDTPALIFYKERIVHNIEHAMGWVNGDVTRLRPHIKTFKNKEILELYKNAGITKVKTATITETELAASAGMPDVLLAYQPHNQKLNRLVELIKKYPDTKFSTLVDNLETAYLFNQKAIENNLGLDFFVDVNVGMNRTGFSDFEQLETFSRELRCYKKINFRGFHVYDGHLKNKDWKERTKDCATYFQILEEIKNKIGKDNLEIVAGGSNTFPFYAKQTDAVCSPGTFVLWDDNYSESLPEQKFLPAAVLVAQVVSIPKLNHICIDIGSKKVSSEHTLDKRLRVLNYEKLKPISQSEEHFVFEHSENIKIPVGSIIYAMPFHICPTVALYKKAHVVENNKIVDEWKIVR